MACVDVSVFFGFMPPLQKLRSEGCASNILQFVFRLIHTIVRLMHRVRTGPGKPGKSWNLIIWIPRLESHGIL